MLLWAVQLCRDAVCLARCYLTTVCVLCVQLCEHPGQTCGEARCSSCRDYIMWAGVSWVERCNPGLIIVSLSSENKEWMTKIIKFIKYFKYYTWGPQLCFISDRAVPTLNFGAALEVVKNPLLLFLQVSPHQPVQTDSQHQRGTVVFVVVCYVKAITISDVVYRKHTQSLHSYTDQKSTPAIR